MERSDGTVAVPSRLVTAGRLTPVEIGRHTGRDAEIMQGLAEGTRVIVHPPDSVGDGVRVTELNRR